MALLRLLRPLLLTNLGVLPLKPTEKETDKSSHCLSLSFLL